MLGNPPPIPSDLWENAHAHAFSWDDVDESLYPNEHDDADAGDDESAYDPDARIDDLGILLDPTDTVDFDHDDDI